jgi:hypothetical protein
MPYRPAADLQTDAGAPAAGPGSDGVSAIAAALARWKRLWALALYFAMTAIVFAPPLGSNGLRASHLGWSSEATFFVWCLAWWPYAISHHLNPLISKFIFAPTGLNLTWTPSVPLMALIAWPLTATLGPTAAYNVLCLACPALAAWTAFLLCRHLTGGFWPPLLAGWIFGFSPFVIGQIYGGHLCLFAVFPLPLMVLVALLRLEDRISARAFMLWLCALLAGEFLIFTEAFATMTLIGGLTLVGGWLLTRGALRRRIAALLVPIALAYLGTAALLSPYLYYLFAGYRTAPFHSAQEFSADLLNLVFPTKTTALWRALPLFSRVSSRFIPNISECDAYVGLPLLIVAAWFTIQNGRMIAGRLCAALLLITAVASTGPVLHIGGASHWPMPWRFVGGLPLLDQMLPIRLCLYLFLILAVMASMWLSDTRLHPAIRLGAAALIIASLCPKPLPSSPKDSWLTPAFFRDGTYRDYLHEGDTVAMLPLINVWKAGCMAWQAESGMYFRLAAGYVWLTPRAYMRWPAVRSAFEDYDLPQYAEQWKAFLASHRASALIVVHGDSPNEIRKEQALEPLLAALGTAPVKFGRLSFYRIPAAILAPYRDVNAVEMEALSNADRFDAVMVAAHRYLAEGGPAASLSPLAAAQRGLIPTRWLYGPRGDGRFRDWLGGEPDGRVSVGVLGTAAAVEGIIDRYGGYAEEVRYPYPSLWGEGPLPADPASRWWLTMVFKPAGLARAVALATAQPPRLVRKSKGPSPDAAAAEASPW